MKYNSSVLLATALLALASCSKQPQQPAGHDEHLAAQAVQAEESDYYTCPMHPWVRSDKPGACPVCGMALVKHSAQAAAAPGDIRMISAVSLSPSQRVMANISTQPVVRQTLSPGIQAVGVLGYAEPNQATVSARFNGRIEKLYVNYTGDAVRKGQPLFDLYSPDLFSAEQEFLLALQGVDSLRGVDSSVAAQQEALLQAARDRLLTHFGLTRDQIAAVARTRVVKPSATYYSPIHGTVVSKQIQEGQYVSEGMLLYQLADLSTLWVYVDVYESDIRNVRLGQTADITADAYPGEVFKGRVTFIEPSVDPQTRTVRVRMELANPSGKLKPQMYVQAQLSVRTREGLVVPSTAVLLTGKRNIVWVEVAPDVFEPRDVVLGSRTDATYQVLSGLREGDMVAVTGGFMLESESELQQPAVGHQHASESGAVPSSQPNESKKRADDVRTVKIDVDGNFVPNVIHAKRGEPIRLLFFREQDSGCVREVVFAKLNIRKSLAPLQTTPVDLTPLEKGEISFACGMDMVKGKIVVE